MVSKSEHESADESKASDSSTTIGNDKETQPTAQSTAQSSKNSKIKSKSKKFKGTGAVDESSTTTSASTSTGSESNGRTGTGQLNATQLEAVLKNNPALKSELGDLDAEKLKEKMKGMGIEDLLTGTVRALLKFSRMR